MHEKDTNNRDKLNVWIGLTGNGRLVGPIFFDANINGEAYLDVLVNEVVPQIRNIYRRQFGRVWWFQDGEPAHRRVIVRDFLTQTFGAHVVAVGHAVEYPPRSPDLTPLDFFLWGYLKHKVYEVGQLATTMAELLQKIEDEAGRIPQQLIRAAMNAMVTSAQKCLDNNGRHIEGRSS